MKNIFFIRHGETNNNKVNRLQGRGINASINERGLQQAESLIDALQGYEIQKVVTSSLIRTLETATPLIEKTNPIVESYSALDEMSFGVLEGKNISEVKDTLSELQKRWSSGEINLEIEGGESPAQVFERAGSKVYEVLKESVEENIVFVLHGRLIRILLSEFLEIGLKNMHQIEHENGAINHLNWNGKGFEIVELNKTDHLRFIEVELS